MSIIVTYSCPESRVEELGIKKWPIWSCDECSFEWTQDDKETCLFLEGEVTITPEEGQPIKFGAGDLVIFPEGMNCTRDILHQAVRKHYRFGN